MPSASTAASSRSKKPESDGFAIVEKLILRNHYTAVIVTHNFAQARRVANYAAFFWMTERVGQLIEFGRSQTLFDSPKHQVTAAYVTGISG